MARQILANQATAAKRRVYFHLVDATDGITAETGEADGQPQISTNGGAWTDTGIGVLVAIGNGRYYAELTQAAVATAGDILETRYKSAETAEAVGDQVHVVAYDPDNAASLGLTNLDAAVSTRLASAGAAAAIADAVWDEGLAGHQTAGSAGEALSDAGGLAGARQITLQVRDGESAPVPDCFVSVYDSSNTTHLGTVISGADGNVIVNLDDGTYKLRPRKAGYTFTTPQTLVVAADASATITATAWAPSPASSPDLCVVFGTLRDASGEVAEGAVVQAVAEVPAAVGGNQLTSLQVTATTDEDGYFELELARGAAVKLTIPIAGMLNTERTVPDAASQDLASWAA